MVFLAEPLVRLKVLLAQFIGFLALAAKGKQMIPS
jgi:hypothetical protein